MSFRWISLFSGAGCGDLGLHRAGHEVVAMVEFDKAAAGVAAHNFPGIPIHCDVTKVDPADLPDADGLLYSFPCQDVSQAGNRKGFKGERSSLYEEAIRIIHGLRDRGLRITLAENVYGLMSSNSGSDFERLLGDLLDVGHTSVGWTILDSQHVGFSFPQSGGSDDRGTRRAVPQRRRRVFVLGTFGRLGGESIAEIFSLKHRIRGYLEEGRGQKQDPPANTGGGFTATSFGKYEPGVGTLRSAGGDLGGGSETIVANQGIAFEPRSADGEPRITGDINKVVSPTLNCMGGGQREPAVCSWNGDVTPKSSEDVSLTLRAQQGGEGIGVAIDLNVRRITPLEAERLQGLSDGFTLNKEVLELDGNIWKPTCKVVEQKDGPRYRQLGNGITAHVMEWIARRISEVVK
jgi:DNA (cytosine-5)-methyltransferase 1